MVLIESCRLIKKKKESSKGNYVIVTSTKQPISTGFFHFPSQVIKNVCSLKIFVIVI